MTLCEIALHPGDPYNDFIMLRIRVEEFKLNSVRYQREIKNKHLQELEAKLPYEAYLRARERPSGFVSRTYEEHYRSLSAICNIVAQQVAGFDETIAEHERQIAEYQTQYDHQHPICEREKEVFTLKYSYELDPAIKPFEIKGLDYYLQAFFTIAMTLSFMTLLKISPAFKAIVTFIAGVALVNYLTNDRNSS